MNYSRIVLPIFTAFFLAQVSCQKPEAGDTDMASWEHRAWIGKTARLLRSGQGLTPKDDIEALSKMSKEQVVAHFMSQPVFSNTVFDFNLFFLGFKNDPLQTEKGYFQDKAFYIPGAVASARETFADGDYFQLFKWRQPLFLNPMRRLPFPMSGMPTPSPGKEAEEVREGYLQKSMASMDKLLTLTEQGYNKNFQELCKIMLATDGPFNSLSFSGIQSNLFFAIRGTPNWFADIYLPCTLSTGFNPPSDADALKRVKAIHSVWPKVIELARATNPERYLPETVADLMELKLKEFNLEGEIYQLNRATFISLANSSTNFNRKRSAFVLKRFFCDDLTPIMIEDPGFHTRGAHASDPACMSCHYKLDPMAGFFRDFGYGGYPFGGKPKIMFDDMAVTDREAYQAAWKAPEGADREWNVGYVRSLQFPEKNEWGESIEDLFAIINRAPEVKRCVVKRLSQYVLGEEQMIDAGYLQYLVEEFNKQAETNSAKAFKATMSRLILSQTLQKRDPQPSQCYDYAPGESPDGRPPCRVAKLIENNCVQCHSGSSTFGGLDLSVWEPDAMGKLGFRHKDSAGSPLAAHESFSRVLDRLEQSDSSLRMPLGKYMIQSDRVELVLWAREYLKGIR